MADGGPPFDKYPPRIGRPGINQFSHPEETSSIICTMVSRHCRGSSNLTLPGDTAIIRDRSHYGATQTTTLSRL